MAGPDNDDGASRRSGWLDLDRVRVSVNPGSEWSQMFKEAWRLQRDFFWTEDMGSLVYANACKARRENIVAMLTPERIGCYLDEPGTPGSNDAGAYLKLSAMEDGSFTMFNSRTNATRRYPPRK